MLPYPNRPAFAASDHPETRLCHSEGNVHDLPVSQDGNEDNRLSGNPGLMFSCSLFRSPVMLAHAPARMFCSS